MTTAEDCSLNMFLMLGIGKGLPRGRRMRSVAGSSCIPISGESIALGICSCSYFIGSIYRCVTDFCLTRVSGCSGGCFKAVVDFASSAIMSVNIALKRFCFDLHLDSMDCAAD